MFSRYPTPRPDRVRPARRSLPRPRLLDGAVIASALLVTNLCLAVSIDRPRELEDVLAAQAAVMVERDHYRSQYMESYTSGRFFDFDRWGLEHPMLIEYADDLLACAVGDDVLSFQVSVDARGRRHHLVVARSSSSTLTTTPGSSTARPRARTPRCPRRPKRPWTRC